MGESLSSRCCVIGGTGFIGRAVVPLLRKRSREVLVVHRSRAPVPEELGVAHVRGNYGDPVFLEEILTGVDEVIHLAYASVPKTSVEDPLADLLQNLPPALTLLEVASKLTIKKLVLVSSGGTVYGQARALPIAETHPTNPISPYGITKLAIEKYADLFFALRELPVVIVRPSNGYGEEQKPFAGQGFIATAIASALRGRAIEIFGETGCVRDYIHVSDIARGILAALEHGRIGECYNLGTGVGTNNIDVIDQLMRLAEKIDIRLKIAHLPDRTFDVARNILDCTKMKRDTCWEPSVSLEAGLARTWDCLVARHG